MTPDQPSQIEVLGTRNEPGYTAYYNPYSGTYTRSRSYGLRMQSGYQRGLTQQQARRGPMAVAEVSESQRRRERELELYGETPWQRFTRRFEARYGFPYSYWVYLRRNWISEINNMSSPGGRITPDIVATELSASAQTGHNEEWVEARLDEKLDAMYAYREGDSSIGLRYWEQKDSFVQFWQIDETYNPLVWWYYH